uniref:Ig-like domain-containing protein n=1 Tax=Fundulus heteroclitus TaxID=8078 RepID=A0A3Q2PXL1_FUNHE
FLSYFLITAVYNLYFLTVLDWISTSHCQFDIVTVQAGKELTLRCSNFSTFLSHIFWFKLTHGSNIHWISSMYNAQSIPSFYDLIQHGKFNMTSNTTDVFLNIKPLDVNDSGLYFCGFYASGFPVVFTATHLQVKVDHFEEIDGSDNQLNWILGGIVICLALVIIGFIVKIRNLYTAVVVIKCMFDNMQNLDSCTQNYAALNFHPKAKIDRRSGREMEKHVLYSATR